MFNNEGYLLLKILIQSFTLILNPREIYINPIKKSLSVIIVQRPSDANPNERIIAVIDNHLAYFSMSIFRLLYNLTFAIDPYDIFPNYLFIPSFWERLRYWFEI